MDSYLFSDFAIYFPFFVIFFALYFYNSRSIWKGRLIECLALANGVGAFFLFLVEALIFPPIHIDIVTISSIIITGLDAAYTGKLKKPRKPKIVKEKKNNVE